MKHFRRCIVSLILGSGLLVGFAQTAKPADTTTTNQSTEVVSDLAAQIAEGGEIVIEAGEYALESIVITKDTKLIGAGRDKTIIRLSAAQEGLSVTDVDFELDGISFVHDGLVGADTAVFRDSVITLNDCAFSGATQPEGEEAVGAGAFFVNVDGDINNCSFNNNQTGVILGRNNILAFNRVEIKRNLGEGFLAITNAYAALEFSEISQNGTHGVFAEDEAYLRLHRNNIEQNAGSGVVLTGRSNAVVIGTLIKNNEKIGLLINGEGHVWIDNSESEGNSIGFGFNGKAQAFLKRTKSRNNILGYYGIGESTVTIQDGLAANNEEEGFSFSNFAVVTLHKNTARSNGLNGFRFHENTVATLTLNLANNNLKSGFFFADDVDATLTSNLSEKNALHGIVLAHRAKLSSSESELSNNEGYGLFVAEDDGVTFTGQDNIFEDNDSGGSNYDGATP